jgi:beta-lactamase regulating signal transducer with metallopeptidase domain
LSNAVTATFLAFVVACLGRVLARRPAVLHCLWLLVLLKLVTPPLYEVPVPWPHSWTATQEPRLARLIIPPEPTDATDPSYRTDWEPATRAEYSVPEVVVEFANDANRLIVHRQGKPVVATLAERTSIDWMKLATLIWLAGTMTTVVLSVCRTRRFQMLLREARPASEDTQDLVDELSMRLGLLRTPSVWWINGRLSPLVWAVGLRSRLIIPLELWKNFDDRQRSTLVVHELAHLRRGDHHVRIFELIVTAFFWWHPVVWWVRHALRDVEEQCCDAWVVWAFPESAKSYAETLLETLDFLNHSDRPAPLLASGFGKVHHLRRRLTMIMSGTTPRLLGVRGTLALLGMAALLLPVNATWGQKPEQKTQLSVDVQSDNDSTKAADATATVERGNPKVDGGLPQNYEIKMVRRVANSLAAGQPEAIDVQVKTPTSSLAVSADSIEQAIDKLKELAAKPAAGDQAKETQKALRQVIEVLESQATRTKSGRAAAVQNEKDKAKVNVRLWKNGGASDDSKLTPERKAEIDKARARVDELIRSLKANQQKLAEAQKALSELEGSQFRGTMSVRPFPNVATRNAPLEPPRFAYTVVKPKPPIETDQQRIDAIEKALKKLLEEVASLKEARGK